MTLTMGTGPFAPKRGGEFNFDTAALKPHTLYFEPSPKRVRVEFGGETVVDTRRAKTLHETAALPVYYLPLADARMDLLEPTGHTTHCPFKGDASYWTIRAGGQVAENAVWGYPEPLTGAPALAGHVAFYADRMDAWYEEDDRVLGHPHDPYHRVDVHQSSRHVRISLEGEVLAESDRPKMVFETGLPPRYYLRPEDVRTDLLTPSATSAICPYKGVASHWTLRVDGREVVDAAWSYPEPLPEASSAPGWVCFYDDKVTVEVDGERIG